MEQYSPFKGEPPVQPETIRQWARDHAADLVAWRRYLHAHPELSFAERETSRYVSRHLDAHGIPWTNPAGNSIVGVVEGSRRGRTVAVRADMDALPILEENDFEYKSTQPGVMHACGHDGHTAILMGVARLLAGQRDFPGTVKLIFQEAEELPPGGAQALVQAGALDQVDHVIGLHLVSSIPTGRAEIIQGPIMAAADGFTARIYGKGGHGGVPHQAIDAVVAASSFVMNLQTVVARKVNPLQPAVVSVGRMDAGFAFNVIAPSAELQGTLRSFDPAVRQQLRDEVERTLEATCAVYGARYELEVLEGYPVVWNHPHETEAFRAVCLAALGHDPVMDANPLMWGEDFACYAQHRPAAFLFLGCGNPDRGASFPHHHPRFTIDEDALPTGVEVLVGTALRLLEP